MRDEGPSSEDLLRFGGEGDDPEWCPECGEEIWASSPQCPSCNAWILGRTEIRPTAEVDARKRMKIVIAIITLLAFTGLIRLLM